MPMNWRIALSQNQWFKSTEGFGVPNASSFRRSSFFMRATTPPGVASTALPELRGRRGEHRLERGHVRVEPIQRGVAHGDRAAAVDDAAM